MSAPDPGGHLLIEVLSPRLGSTFMSDVIHGICAVAEAAGARTIAIQTLDLSVGSVHVESLPEFHRRIAWHRVAGFIVLHRAVDAGYLKALQETGKAVVGLTEHVRGSGVLWLHRSLGSEGCHRAGDGSPRDLATAPDSQTGLPLTRLSPPVPLALAWPAGRAGGSGRPGWAGGPPTPGPGGAGTRSARCCCAARQWPSGPGRHGPPGRA